ncbi:MAG: mechanosensitive ion channel [Cytophagales bacterium]|nr:mechanosensitive ion channel [Cytophagales bacterium]
MKTLSILVICIGFLTINFFLRKGTASIKGRTGIPGFVNRYFPLLELGFWSVFSFWAIALLFDGSQFFNYVIHLLLALAVILFFWFFLRDYIAGILLKTRYNLSYGQYLKSGLVRGVIKKIRLLFIEIQTDDGSTCMMPYTRIDRRSIELDIRESQGGESLIRVFLDGRLDESVTSRKIRQLVINSPWCAHKSHLRVHVKESKAGIKTYEISCKTNTERGSKRIKELIERKFTAIKQ